MSAAAASRSPAPLRIWVNRNYSTTLHLLGQLRHNPDGVAVTIIGTHADRDSPVLAGCDEIGDEPPAGVVGSAYARWALAFAAEHRVDVVWPRYEQESVAAAAGDFAAAGIAVVAPPAGVIAACEDKVRAYEIAAAAGVPVPPWRLATDVSSLRAAIAEIAAEVEPAVPICVKPVGGVGGVGFRIIRDEPPSWAQLTADPEPTVTTAGLLRAYDTAGAPEPLLVQPWLDDPELSVDLLADRGSVLAAVTRGKPVGGPVARARWIGDEPAVAAPVIALARALGLHSLANVQFRWWQGTPMLLEVNPRASAGLHQSALAGVDLAWAAVRLARGLAVGPFARPGRVRYADVPGVVLLPSGPSRAVAPESGTPPEG